MGGAASSLLRPSQISSGKDLIAKTKDVREMSDALFRFMYSVWEEKEIVDIANRPGDYIIALSDMIHTQFHVLGYTTAKNKVGEIYFMRYDKLKPPSEDRAKGIEKQRENAKIIAFYFIRIFQILGAMLLVVKDISFPIKDASGKIMNIGKPEEPYRPYTNQTGPVLSRFRPPIFSQSAGGNGYFPRKTPLGPYEFLRYYLRDVSESDVSEYRNKYKVELNKTNLYMITPVLFFEYKVDTSPPVIRKEFPLQTFKLLTYSKDYKTTSLDSQQFKITDMVPERFEGYFSPGDDRFRSSPEEQKRRYPTRLTFEVRIDRGSKKEEFKITIPESSYKKSDYENGIEYTFMREGQLINSIAIDKDLKKDFKKILELLVLVGIRAQKGPSIQIYSIKTDESKEFKPREIGAMPSKFTNPIIDEFYQVLKKGTHQPHCISRALQIIDTTTIQEYSPKISASNICRFAVGDQTGPIDMATYKPLKSVSQLFGKINPANFKESMKILESFVERGADGKAVDVEKLKGLGQKNEAADLSAALKSLAAAFAYSQEEPIKSFSDIKISRPSECKTTAEMEVKQPYSLNLQRTARELLAYHVNHTIEISKFLKTIFNIKNNPDGTFKVEGPKTEILFAGFPALDQITDQARELLIDYYSGCEEVYQRGIQAWKASVGDTIPVAATSRTNEEKSSEKRRRADEERRRAHEERRRADEERRRADEERRRAEESRRRGRREFNSSLEARHHGY